MSDQAEAAGFASLPDPDDAALAADWLWIDELPVLYSGVAGANMPYFAAQFDVRGMRKMHGYNKKLIFISKLVPDTGRTQQAFWLSMRILLLGEP